MSWNYRVVKVPDAENNPYLRIEEVYYNKDGIIKAFGDAPVPYGYTLEDLRDCISKMLLALDKEIIDRNNELQRIYKDGTV